MLARHLDDLRAMIERGLTNPVADSEKRLAFMRQMMADTLDGNSGMRVADVLVSLVSLGKSKKNA